MGNQLTFVFFLKNAFFLLIFLLVSCQSQKASTVYGTRTLALSNHLAAGERIIYQATATLPFSKKKIFRAKVIGGSRNGFSLDPTSNKLVNFRALWKSELNTSKSKYGKKSRNLLLLLKKGTRQFHAYVKVHCNLRGVFAPLYRKKQKLGRFVTISKEERRILRKTIKDRLTACRQKVLNRLLLLKIPLGNVIKSIGHLIEVRLNHNQIILVARIPEVRHISVREGFFAKNLTCSAVSPEKDYFGGKSDEVGLVNLYGLSGQGVNVAMFELGIPDLAHPCFNRGGIAAPKFNPNMKYQRDFSVTDPSNDRFFHADLVAGRLVSRKGNPSYPLCHQLLCQTIPQIKDPFGYYGAARGINLLLANVGAGMDLMNANSGGFYWAATHPTLPANIFTVSLVVQTLVGYSPFNQFDSEADDVYLALPVMGAGNDPEQSSVANVTMNGLVVGVYWGPSGPIGGTTSNPDCDAPSSCHSPHGDMHKPDVLATDDDGGSSTSLATPIVASLAALLMERLPLLKSFPRAVKALIMATACKVFGDTTPGSLSREVYGAGGINGEHALRVLDQYLAQGAGTNTHPSLGWRLVWHYAGEFEYDAQNARWRYKWPGGQPTFTVESEYTIRTALTWDHHYDDPNFPTNKMTDFDLVLQRFDTTQNKWIDQSYAGTYDNNAEIVRLNVDPSNSGQYRIEIVRFYFSSETFTDKIAWATFVWPSASVECQ